MIRRRSTRHERIRAPRTAVLRCTAAPAAHATAKAVKTEIFEFSPTTLMIGAGADRMAEERASD